MSENIPYAYLALAEKIANSDPVLATFAAPEWDELGEDGKVWIAAIVRETFKHRDPIAAPSVLDLDPGLLKIGDVVPMPARPKMKVRPSTYADSTAPSVFGKGRHKR